MKNIAWVTYHKSSVELAGQRKVVKGTVAEELKLKEHWKIAQGSLGENTVNKEI